MQRDDTFSCFVFFLILILLCTAGCLSSPLHPFIPVTTSPAPITGPAVTPQVKETSYVIVETPEPAPANVTDKSPQSYQDLVIIPGPTDSTAYRRFDFRYRSDNYVVNIPVNTSLYRAATISPNKLQVFGSEDFGFLYREMMEDPALDSFYTDMLKEIRRTRYKGGYNLTDDEYLEMVTSFVQQIPYDNTTAGNPRYPVEVIFEGKGDCDEKALLLNGLLSREGYDVALLAFPSLKHVASGIRINIASNKPSFRVFSDGKRDYVYIETTATRLIGFYSDDYIQVPQPIVVPVGTGTLQYTKINYLMKIFFDIQTMEDQLAILDEKAGTSRTLGGEDYKAAISYVKTYTFVMSTNDVDAAWTAIRNSELRHHTTCVSCG
ncbi:MAG: hypothetical protein Q8S57_04590 [Methanoregula sp.]|nr:hypothetical protein [Methanoregula sp.]